MTMHKLLALAALVAVTPALADTCMVSPTEKQTVSGRFGKFRGGGASPKCSMIGTLGTSSSNLPIMPP